MELLDLCGEHILSGIERGQTNDTWDGAIANYIKFCIDGINYMAVEDPADGYRSYLNDLYTTEERCKIILPATRVIVIRETDQIISFVDMGTTKIVLRIGTGDYGDYYPYCIQDWYPENLSCNKMEV